MTLLLTVAPEAEPVTLAEAKAHLRLAGSGDDTLIAGLIRAARQDVERATGLALIAQDWRLVLDRLPPGGTVLIGRNPVQEILGVTIYGSEGEASLIAPGDIEVDLVSRPARLHVVSLPRPLRMMNGIEIDFRAGFGEAGTDVPDGLRRAILLLVAHWYEFRSGYGPDDQPVSYPPAYARLIAPFREVRV